MSCARSRQPLFRASMGDPCPTPPMSHSGLCGRGLHIASGCGLLPFMRFDAKPNAESDVLGTLPLRPRLGFITPATRGGALASPHPDSFAPSLPCLPSYIESTLTPSTLTPSIPCLEHSPLAGTRPTPHITGQLPYHTQAPAAAVPSPPLLPSLPFQLNHWSPSTCSIILSLSPDSLPNQRFLPA